MSDNSKVLTVAPAGGELAEVINVGKILAESGFFSDAKGMAQAVAKILAGKELGVGPIASMTGVVIINGKVSYTANLMANLIKRSGRYDYRIRKLDNDNCDLEFFQRTGPSTWESMGHSTFGKADATTAQLNTANYTKFARNMFFARAMSNGAKWYCPDVFGGNTVYTPEEIGATVDPETGEIIDAPAREVTESHNGDALLVTEPDVAPPNTPARQRLLKRWGELWGEAALLGISDVEPLPGNADEAEITRRGQELAIRIKQAKQA